MKLFASFHWLRAGCYPTEKGKSMYITTCNNFYIPNILQTSSKKQHLTTPKGYLYVLFGQLPRFIQAVAIFLQIPAVTSKKIPFWKGTFASSHHQTFSKKASCSLKTVKAPTSSTSQPPRHRIPSELLYLPTSGKIYLSIYIYLYARILPW